MEERPETMKELGWINSKPDEARNENLRQPNLSLAGEERTSPRP